MTGSNFVSTLDEQDQIVLKEFSMWCTSCLERIYIWNVNVIVYLQVTNTVTFFFSVDQIIIEKRRNSQWTSTRMHSSRMRTARMLLYGGVSLTETPLDRDPLPLWTDRHLWKQPSQTSFVGGKNTLSRVRLIFWMILTTSLKTLSCHCVRAKRRNC